MGFVSSANFAILVNGSPNFSFHSSRGLGKGSPLSPLLFVMVIKGLKRLIGLAKMEKKIKGLKVSSSLFVSCVLFIDNILIVGHFSLDEQKQNYDIFKSFSIALGVLITEHKSCFYF